MSPGKESRLRFVGGRRLSGLDLVTLDGRPVVESAARLRALIATHVGQDAARLFAEPALSGGNGQAAARIEWYTQLDGEVSALRSLDAARAETVIRKARARCEQIATLFRNAEVGPLAAAAFNVAGPDAVLAVGDEPLIVDWGLSPAGHLADEVERERHFAEALDRPLGLSWPTPPVSRETWFAAYGGGDNGGLNRRPGPALAPTLATSAATSRVAMWAVAILAVLVAVSYLPGVLRFPSDAPSVVRTEISASHALLVALNERRARLEEAITYACSRLRTELPALVPQSPGSIALPAPEPGTGPRATYDPAAPAQGGRTGPRDNVPADAAQPAADGDQGLSGRLARATVLVIAGEGTGSGFFVSDSIVVTNRHVVEGADRIVVASQAIGVVEARTIRTGRDGVLGDFAVLRVSPQRTIRPLQLTTPGAPLLAVVSTGFPSLQLATDPVFRRLLAGDAEAARALTPVFGTGVVNHVQRPADGATLLLHGAEISPGNSGGPLTDYCGRVVGVNTFIRTDDRLPVTARYALGTDGLSRFLEESGVATVLEQAACDLRGQARPSSEPSAGAAVPAGAASPQPAR